MNIAIPVSTFLALAFLVGPLSQDLAYAANYLIRPDGTGDLPTIQDALNRVNGQDVIELSDGVFEGPGNAGLQFPPDIGTIIRSTSGDPSRTTLNGGGFSMRGGNHSWRGITFKIGIFSDRSMTIASKGCVLVASTLRFENGRLDLEDCTVKDNSMIVYNGSRGISLRRCQFANNKFTGGNAVINLGGGDSVIDSCSFQGGNTVLHGRNINSLKVSHSIFTSNGRCLFLENSRDCVISSSTFNGNTDSPILGATLVEDCTILNSYVPSSSYAAVGTGKALRTMFMFNQGGPLPTPALAGNAEKCWFVYNQLAIEVYDGTTIEGCTLYGNDLGVRIYGAGAIIRNCIISGGNQGFACTSSRASVSISCTDVWPATLWTGGCALWQAARYGNFSADPEFFRPGSDFHLEATSPCLPGNNPSPDGADCGLIGAFSTTDDTPVRSVTWGAIKSGFGSQ